MTRAERGVRARRFSGSGDATVRVWKVDGWECVATLREHSRRGQQALLAPPSRLLSLPSRLLCDARS